jgi:hypothetical protein
VYLNNGQWFRADLIRLTPKEIIVSIGGLTEIDFEKSTIGRVEDDAGNILYPEKKVMVPDPVEPEPSEVMIHEPAEPEVSDVTADSPKPEPSEFPVSELTEPEITDVITESPESEPSEVPVPDLPDPEFTDVNADPAESESPEAGVRVIRVPGPEDVDAEALQSGPSVIVISEPPQVEYRESEPPQAEYREDDEEAVVHTPPPKSVRFHRFYTRALNEGSLSLGGLVTFSSFGGDINEGAYGIGEDERLNLFAIAPNITYFVRDNIGLGADVMYNREWLNDRIEDKLSLGPRAVYAFPLDKAFRPYVAVGAGVMWWKFNENERAYSRMGMTIKVGPGLLYFVNEHYAVNMELNYRWDRFDTDLEVYPITGNALLFSVGLSGFIY